MELDMQIGDRVTYKNSMNDIRQVIIKDEEQKNKYCNNKTAFEILKIERPKYETIEEKKELLTEEEKEFLKSYIKLLNIDNLDYIERELNGLYIYTRDTFYRVDIDNLFSNLTIAKHYRLKELRLE